MKHTILKSYSIGLIILVFLHLQPLVAQAKVANKSSILDHVAQSIESKVLKVSIDESFPRVIEYRWNATGDILYGQEDRLSQVKINGKCYTPKVTFSKNKAKAEYLLDIPELNVTIKLQLSVNQNIVEMNVTQILEKGTFKVSSFEIPNHSLISVRSTQSASAFAGAKMYTAVKGNGDSFLPLSGKIATDSIPAHFLFGMVNTNQLAASIWSNSVGEKNDDGRVQKQTVNKDGYYRTGVWSGSWIYRAERMTATDPMPVVKVVITNDANKDNKVDWQDAAIAHRLIMNNPLGTDRIRDLVVERIPMNFASQATNPFTKTLDETKRIYLNTDGLGQFVILKGYGSEGHDSGHPDYGVIGKRQGGAADMEMLCKAAQKYNAFMGVHINGTESYGEAKAFNDTLMDKKKKGWDWLDASYYIDKRYDALTNSRMARLKSLKDQVPSLNFIYCDVWYAKGSWDSRKLAREIHSLGMTLGTEFPNDHEYDAVWNHWAVDYNYGGKDIKGFSSQIARFIRNHQKDTWIGRHPLLGGAEMNDFEGWQGRNSIDSCVTMAFHTGLPTKYIQHFPILKWEDKTITLENNVVVSNETGVKVISKDGRIVLKGKSYLLPWNPMTEDKLYHWSEVADTTTWSLPASWKGLKSVKLYQLTDLGRKFAADLKVVNGEITIVAKACTPYVVYKKEVKNEMNINWGEGALVKDPGFNNADLKHWNVNGNAAKVVRSSRGQYELIFDKGEETTVSQTITGLNAGSYYASVYVSTPGNRRANLTVTNYGGANVSATCNSSLWKNYIAADSKSDTTMQRMYVFFTVPQGKKSADLVLSAEAGTSKVAFDDVRVMPINYTAKPDSIYFAEDFENVPDGVYPFVKCESGGINDPRTHLAELNAPYTQKGWNNKKIDDVISGKWSLKAHGEPTGLLLQTIPQTLRFVAGKKYQVTFKYEATSADYALAIGDGVHTRTLITLNESTVPQTVTFTLVASDNGNSWFGIEKLNDNDADFVMDELVVTEK